MRFPNPLKPWFLYRPRQIIRRMVCAFRTPNNPIQIVHLPWGCSLEVDIRETVGRAIWTAGVYDLAVVEVLTRLADPELLAIDAGANIGAMTGALAARAAEVWAFEPHPVVAGRLLENVVRFGACPGFAPCRVFQQALSDSEGEARLENPDGFATNHGLARLTTGVGLSVRTTPLDDQLGLRDVGVMKLDVEGHELSVLRGAEGALAAGRIRHIVFEDHAGSESRVCEFLGERGYHIFEIGWRLTGPVVTIPGKRGARRYEAPSYLATRDPDGAIGCCRARGWDCFRPLRRTRKTG